MKAELKEKVDKDIAGWAYMKALPEEWHGFKLTTERSIEDDVYNLYRYVNESIHRSVIAYYHAETNEYKLR